MLLCLPNEVCRPKMKSHWLATLMPTLCAATGSGWSRQSLCGDRAPTAPLSFRARVSAPEHFGIVIVGSGPAGLPCTPMIKSAGQCLPASP